jgi:hypothetical protein
MLPSLEWLPLQLTLRLLNRRAKDACDAEDEEDASTKSRGKEGGDAETEDAAELLTGEGVEGMISALNEA